VNCPNSFSALYREVNERVLDDSGTLTTVQIGLNGEQFTTMDLFNQTAHGSFMSLGIALGLLLEQNRMDLAGKMLFVWNQFTHQLDFIEERFKQNQTRAEVLSAFKKNYVKSKTISGTIPVTP
jgi:hypothetical protein